MVADNNNDDEKDYHEGNDDDVDEDDEDNKDDCEAEACCRAFKWLPTTTSVQTHVFCRHALLSRAVNTFFSFF